MNIFAASAGCNISFSGKSSGVGCLGAASITELSCDENADVGEQRGEAGLFLGALWGDP